VHAAQSRLYRVVCAPQITMNTRIKHKKYESEMGNCEFAEKLLKNNVYAYLTNKFDTQLANT
jgi:hypothetical protein